MTIREEKKAIALVLGFSIHGLAVARALNRSGTEVHAISESPDIPTARTSAARLHFDGRINTEGAIDCIVDYCGSLDPQVPIVLFPTNDRIVEMLADHWERLPGNVHLSWSNDRRRIRQLMRKDGFSRFVAEHDLDCPISLTLESPTNIESVKTLRTPIVVKPAKPLGSFKALRYETHEKAIQDSDRWIDDFPLVIQEWIDGDDTSLVFASYFVYGNDILAEFTGRKLASSPPGLGQGVLVEKFEENALAEEGRKIVRALGVSGPIAIEWKQSEDGTLWLIEANLGRSEYSVDLLIGAGVNLPVIEFGAVTGSGKTSTDRPVPTRVTWLDTDKEPLILFRYLAIEWRRHQWPGRMIFPYFGHGDFGPLLASARALTRRIAGAIGRRLAKVVGRPIP